MSASDETIELRLVVVLPAWCDTQTVRLAISGFVAMLWQGFAYEVEVGK